MTQKLSLPTITIKVHKHPIGQIIHVARNAEDVDILSEEEIKVSPRKSAKLLRLSNGSSVIVSHRTLPDYFKFANGILNINGNKTKWLAHDLIRQFDAAESSQGLTAIRNEIQSSWRDSFKFRTEKRNEMGDLLSPGLRPPQIGAIHAIGAHWTLDDYPATIVMPTGTGKTETMIATMIAMIEGTVLVVVPSNELRNQTARKFSVLSILRSVGALSGTVRNPIVGIVEKRPMKASDLDIFAKCNLVVGTLSSLGQGASVDLLKQVSASVSAVFIDEAHHVAASTWTNFRDHFLSRRVLQFTATPFRRDGELVDGQVIYNYPLKRAQEHGYFKRISFEPIFEIDPEEADKVIAKSALEKLRADRTAGRDHILMARCKTIDRAKAVHKIYKSLGAEFSPVLVYTNAPDQDRFHSMLSSRQSRVVVCVDMLGEGYDLPALKIAALHDVHKSLAVILQFTGRFVRSSDPSIGDATVIANIAETNVSEALERLYREDANWNALLSEYSSQYIKQHTDLLEFLNQSHKIVADDPQENAVEISHHLLRPKFSVVVFRVSKFEPKKFFEGVNEGCVVKSVWLHESSKTLYFITVREGSVEWSRSHQMLDRRWDLFILHFDQTKGLLYIHSSDKSSTHNDLAEAVSGKQATIISGDDVFRTLGNINRLIFQNIGVRKYGRRNLRFAMYTGADVKEALSITEKVGSVKSNLSGTGFEMGRPTSIGCSLKGRIWNPREQGTIPTFLEWCERIGGKLNDPSIDTTQIIDNVLIPEEVEILPEEEILDIEWPSEIIYQSEERVTLLNKEIELSICLFDIRFAGIDRSKSELTFTVSTDEETSYYGLRVGGEGGFKVRHISGTTWRLRIGRIEAPLENYFSDYPPLVRFVDLSELDGNLLIKPKTRRDISIPDARFEVWDWNETDITKESIWHKQDRRENSIQAQAARYFQSGGFELVFDDDSSGEAADLLCIKEESTQIRLSLVHCKFSGGEHASARIKDVMEVAAQALRSSRWLWDFRKLVRHILNREKRLRKTYRSMRFLVGDAKKLNHLAQICRFKPIQSEIIIVQPGISLKKMSTDQTNVLAAAYSYLKETTGVDLDIVCSS